MAARYSDPSWWEMHPDLVADVEAEVLREQNKRAGMRAYEVFQERLTCTVEEAARMLGISRSLAYDALKRGDIPSVKIGRRILVPIALLHQMLSPVQRGD